MGHEIQIAGIADTSLGYANPQIAKFMYSLIDYYKAQGIIFETDEIFRPPRHDLFPGLKIERINTMYDPWSGPGRIEYIMEVSKAINFLRPDILVIYATFTLPVLLKLKFRPSLVIYYCFEDVLAYGTKDININRALAPMIDLVVFPEENRAVMETERCGFHHIPKAILYNTSNSLTENIANALPGKRNGKIIYQGWIDKTGTFAEYYSSQKLKGVYIDLFGPMTNVETENLIYSLPHNIWYGGVIDSQDLSELRRDYCFSIVMWNPSRPDRLYAAPNKFFESIVAGVPPIAAPHPQCKMLINRYKCGVLMDDWSFDSFYAAIQRALKIYGTERYATMVENCQKAFVLELNWEKQFEKVKPFLKAVE